MSWLTGFLKSSVGRKFVMAITGLFLCFFLIVHLSGNLLLYVPGGQAYVDYAHKLHSNEEFLILAEIMLFTAFALHIVLAFSTTIENRSARKKSYRTVDSKRDDRSWPIAFSPDYTMMITGLIGLIFLVVHISDFKLEWMWTDALADKNSAQKVGVILSDTVRAIIYIAGSLALGYHVSHGLQSACQTIGLNHPKYNRGLKIISIAFGLIVAIGFSSFPFLAQYDPTMFEFPDAISVEVDHH